VKTYKESAAETCVVGEVPKGTMKDLSRKQGIWNVCPDLNNDI
jgi:hypothetical protein